MRQYIIRRLLQMIPILLGVSIVIFFIFYLAPGDPVTSILGQNPHMTIQKRAEIKHMYHLDKPIIIQYFYWLKNIIHGDLGMSYKFKQPVAHIINTYMWNSFYLQLISFILTIVIAIPLGVISAVKENTVIDSTLNIFSLISMSVPTFFLALLLIKFLACDVQVFPLSGMTTTGVTEHGFTELVDVLKHMVLPLITLTIGSVAGIMRYVRTSMLEVIRQDYIRTARSKGLREKVVIYKHALRNGMIPIITILGMSLAGLFGGAIITEQIFAWPGIGKTTMDAVLARDYPLLMGLNMFSAVLVLLGNLIADISYALVDPRIRLK